MTLLKNDTVQDTVRKLEKENIRIEKEYVALKVKIDSVKEANQDMFKDNVAKAKTIKDLVSQLTTLQTNMTQCQQDLTAYEVRQTTILTELNRLKETVMDSSYLLKQSSDPMAIVTISSGSMRSIPAPSKVMVDEQKKRDNRLVELKRITKDCMKVSEEEASLRLYKLQKTMIHVVSDLKKYMIERNEDVCKSWKSIDINTQRVAFEMVEREAACLGVPLHKCIGYWGARRMISKSWANALRTTKKHHVFKPEAYTTSDLIKKPKLK